MRFWTTFAKASAFAALVHAALVAADDAAANASSDVISLTAANYDDIVNPEALILVEFFAPWCGHCKALAPHYEQAATSLKDKGIKLAKVDCVDEADLCQTKSIQGYPTLKVIKSGKESDYSGPRQAEGIISYMIKQSLPAVSEVTADNHAEFRKADKIVVVAYLPSTTDAPAADFSAAAEKHRDDYLFGISTDPVAAEAASVTPPAIVVYRSFDEFQTEYPLPASAVTTAELEAWIGDLAVPVIDEVSGENYSVYANAKKPLAYLFIDPTSEDKQKQIDAIKPIARKFKSQVNFVWIDAIKFGDHAKALNLQETNWPSFVLQDLVKQLKYPFHEGAALNSEAIQLFVEEFLAGKLEPSLKSQPIPETQDEAVFTLVGKHFDDVVFDDSKDVLIEFYAPWCGHCKRLKPTWDSLGEHYAPISDRVLIAKMDATENDIPPSAPFQVSGFPTIKIKPAGTKEFIDYEGNRSLESFIEFVAENAKNNLDFPPVAEVPSTPVVATPPTATATQVATPVVQEGEAQVPLANDPPAHEEL